MTRIDKLILWGACAVMVAVGSLSMWKISQTPKIDPEIVRLQIEYEQIARRRPQPVPEVPLFPDPFSRVLKQPAPTHDWTAFIATKYVGVPVEHRNVDVLILPLPVAGEAKADLNGATFSWTLKDAEATLRPWMKRKEAAPTGFIIRRQCGDGPVVDIAKVGPKERSYTDLSTEPIKTYRYWVLATGQESDLVVDPPTLKPVTKGLNASKETTTPSAARVKLVGGGKDNAVLSVETYDRAQKKWIAGKATTTVPGRGIGTSGWTLKGLRFDNFTLVADVTDDLGVDRVLTTKD
jgi:hypothetical protein